LLLFKVAFESSANHSDYLTTVSSAIKSYNMPPPPVPPKPINLYLNGSTAFKAHATGGSADYVNFEQLAREARNEMFASDAEDRQIDSINSVQVPSTVESVDFSDDSSSNQNKTATMSTSSRSSKTNAYSACNTRKIGKKHHIRLVKGRQGLGFSVTTRDNQVGQCPIYIKTILPNGAAIEDGQLKQGDRLLEVNGIEMTGKTHSEVVSVLRSISTGSEVELLVSRQETTEQSVDEDDSKDAQSSENTLITQPSPKLPRQLPIQKSEPDLATATTSNKQVITLSIPLNDTGSAGLGVSVKGKTSATNGGSTCRDLGIFVKSVFHGGAAFKDGRLRPNDQLMKINGINLLTLTNAQAMETLRRVVVTNDGPDALPNAINLTIARSSQYVDNQFDSENDAFGENIYGRLTHRREASTLSTDSVRINGPADTYEDDERTAEEDDDNVFERTFDRSNATVILASCDLHKSINESENHRKNQFYDEQQPKYEEKGRFNDLTGQSMPFDRPDPLCTPSKSGYRKPFGLLTPNRVDCHIEDDNDQENNDPNVYQRTMLQQLQGTTDLSSKSKPNPKFGSLCALEVQADEDPGGSEAAAETETEVANLSSVTSQMSLNDEEREVFQRDGFGRQSMSEKRHAQLDVKQTDTYKRNRQRKQKNDLEIQVDTNRELNPSLELPQLMGNKKSSLFAAACCCSFGSQMTKSESQSSPSSCPYHGRSQSPQTERSILSPPSSCSTGAEFSNTLLDMEHANRRNVELPPNRALNVPKALANGSDALSHLGLPQNPTISERTQQHVQQWQQQQWLQQQRHHQQQQQHQTFEVKEDLARNRNPISNQYAGGGAPFGMKKSCSLESMQTIMHEMQREQSDYRSPNNLPESYRFKTLKVGRNRPTNESFRTAVDRSYPTGDPRNPMETGNLVIFKCFFTNLNLSNYFWVI
jgi:hypothetical protein